MLPGQRAKGQCQRSLRQRCQGDVQGAWVSFVMAAWVALQQ